MHIQFGLWNFDGQPVAPEHIARVKSIVTEASTQGRGEFADTELYLLHLHEKDESDPDQPFRTGSSLILWDGRLDNKAELVDAMGGALSRQAADVHIVAAAYQLWGTKAFSKFVGDWALSVWNSTERTLVLAKDFLGARHLYYSIQYNSVSWSNILDPLVLGRGQSSALSEEYIAGWFCRFPASHLTPYCDIQAVPPSSYVSFCDGRVTARTHWTFDRAKTVFYKNAVEYEEHFRQLFEKSVTRRLRSSSPVTN